MNRAGRQNSFISFLLRVSWLSPLWMLGATILRIGDWFYVDALKLADTVSGRLRENTEPSVYLPLLLAWLLATIAVLRQRSLAPRWLAALSPVLWLPAHLALMAAF
jgi:hypothetical protein